MSPPPAHQGHLLSPAPPPISPGGHFLDSSWAQGGSWAVLAGFCLPLQHPLAGKPQPSAALFSLFSRALPPYPKHPPPHGSVLCSLARAGLHTPARRLGTCAGGQHRHRHKQKQPQKRARARWGASPAPTFTRKHGGGGGNETTKVGVQNMGTSIPVCARCVHPQRQCTSDGQAHTRSVHIHATPRAPCASKRSQRGAPTRADGHRKPGANRYTQAHTRCTYKPVQRRTST